MLSHSGTVFYVWLQFEWEYALNEAYKAENRLRYITLRVMAGINGPATQTMCPIETKDSEQFLIWPSLALLTELAERLIEALGIRSPLRPHPLDPMNLKLIKDCLLEEDKAISASTFIPKRLLDLGPTQNAIPRIVNRDNFADSSAGHTKIKYAALSYCWGPQEQASQQLCLTKGSMTERYRAISVDQLTPLLRDAVTTCRALGFQHLWIDALCIVQGDIIDWEEQSYEMQQIFQHSSLTICAAAPVSCLGSFLHDRSHINPKLDINFTSREQPECSGLITLRPNHATKSQLQDPEYRVRLFSSFEDDVGHSMWRKRGWVYRKSTFLVSIFPDFVPALIKSMIHQGSQEKQHISVTHTDNWR